MSADRVDAPDEQSYEVLESETNTTQIWESSIVSYHYTDSGKYT